MNEHRYIDQLVRQQWLLPLFPLVAAAIQSLLPRSRRKLSAGICITAMGISCVLAVRAFIATLGIGHGGEHHEVERAIWNFTWFQFGSAAVDLGFVLDPLTAGMAVMVTFVGFWIFVNATGYMAEDENFTRFFCFLSLFAASMIGLVVSNNLLMLFMCWELVGLCSYLLIGFWYFKPAAAAAMKKAFITTRIGDVGFFLGILLLYWQSGTLNLYTYDPVHPGALEQAGKLATLTGWWGLSMAGTIAFLLFIGAMGKSAQFPLHVWLPDAMEGPTPVSALIHAATMVAAGVFMVGRMFPMFAAQPNDWVMDFVMWIGCITAVFSATIAVAQFDIKRVLAYSTCSQLGFMMMGLGAGSVVAGQFHLLTHAFFKALLFLGSGCVIIGTHHEQDMRKMGGLRKYMPITFWCYLIGTLALCGIPPFAGFFSKDEILLTTYYRNEWAWGLGTFAALLTAFYMTRQIFLVFFGQWRGGRSEEHPHSKHAEAHGEIDLPHGQPHADEVHGHAHEPHEVPWNMWLPLMVLSVFAVFMGWLGTPWLGGNLFHHYLAPEETVSEHSDLVLWLSISVGLVGIILGWFIYGRKPRQNALDDDPLALTSPAVFTFLNRKWYVDELYEVTIIRLTGICAVFFRLFDKLVVDGILHAIAWISWGLSQLFRWGGDEFVINGGFDASCESVRLGGKVLAKLQSGRVQNYFRVLSLGTAILLLIYFFKMNQAPGNLLSLITFAPFIGAMFVLLLPKKSDRAIKIVSLVASVVSLIFAGCLWKWFDPNAGLMFEERYAWIPALNVDYRLAVDGFSVTLVLLTAIITPLALLAHWKQDRDVKLFFFLFLLLQTGMFGVFTALNFFHWFIFWELGLIPMYFLIKLWGAEDRTYASFKFFLYTLAGSVTMLLAFAFIYLATNSFDFLDLRQKAASGELATAIGKLVETINQRTGLHMNAPCFASLLFWGAFLGFAIKVPIWPFHTWLPDAHTQAPTGGSMVLAAILLKMGVYGFLRIILPIFPEQVQAHVNILMFLALASIVFGAFAALAQTDFKRLVAYSSVNHMGYAMLGIFATVASATNVADIVNEKAAALNGAVLQMFNHGISSAALFFLVGVIYERTHTRKLSEYGGLRMIMPVYAGVLGISMFSSLGLPGLNGFVGEFLVFKGSFPVVTLVTSLAMIGLVVTAVFLLNMMQKVCFGPLNERWNGLSDMSGREIFIGAVLMLFMFWIGIYPAPFINASNTAVLQLVHLFQKAPETMMALGH